MSVLTEQATRAHIAALHAEAARRGLARAAAHASTSRSAALRRWWRRLMGVPGTAAPRPA
jgi:hypothetical protein